MRANDVVKPRSEVQAIKAIKPVSRFRATGSLNHRPVVRARLPVKSKIALRAIGRVKPMIRVRASYGVNHV